MGQFGPPGPSMGNPAPFMAAGIRAQVHNKTLSVNLAQHAGVLEKLIALNTELMDQLNARTTQKLHPPPPLLPTPLATRPVRRPLLRRGSPQGLSDMARLAWRR